jgi:hypothetical protein
MPQRGGEPRDLYPQGADRWKYQHHSHFGGQHIFSHYASNTLWRSDPALFTEGGDPIEWEITAPTFHMAPYRFQVNALHIGALTGVGLVDGDTQDMEPALLLSYSKDGGASYAAERSCALGAAASAG